MPPPNRPKNRPNRPKRNRPSPRRRGAGGRRAAAKRQQRVTSQRQADRNRGIAAARTSGGNRRTADVRRGGTSTGRESGIAAANKYIPKKKIKSLEQSVGSLDRRIENALKKGDTKTAKDLRSRLNKFTTQLGYARAHEAMISAAPLSQRDQVKKRIKANPNMLDTTGKEIFDETKDQDFIDPTRKLQNEFPDQFSEMYPISSAMQGGLPAVRLAKKAFGADDKQIPYNLEDMPGVRYPLDITFGAGEGATPITTRSDRQAPLDEKAFTISDRQPQFKDDYGAAAPLDPVTIETLQDLGIDENQIGPVQDDPTTDIVEQDSNVGSAIQQYYRQIEQNKKDFPEFFENRSPFFLPEEKKTELNLQAADALKEGEINTYGRQLTDQDLENIGINRAYYNMNFDTPIVQKQVMDYLNQQQSTNTVIPSNEIESGYPYTVADSTPFPSYFNLFGQNDEENLETAANISAANQTPVVQDAVDTVAEDVYIPLSERYSNYQ